MGLTQAMVNRLMALRNQGFSPAGALDIGAYQGEFSILLRKIFPHTRILMVDALEENRSWLQSVRNKIGNADFRISMLGEENKEEIPFYVINQDITPNSVKTGSSKYLENFSEPFDQRLVQQRTLGSVLEETGGSFQFLKIDVKAPNLM